MRCCPILIALLLAAGPARAAEPEQLIGGRVESLLEFARERHPEFAALRAEAESAAARIEPAGALPDPRLRTELRDVTNEGRDASANLLPPRIGSARYSFSQTLPWAGKLDLRRDVAGAGADEARARARAGWVDLATRIKADLRPAPCASAEHPPCQGKPRPDAPRCRDRAHPLRQRVWAASRTPCARRPRSSPWKPT
jgi:cobalt-zinc-cadmium efflux system outer membrane protein